MEFQAFSAGKPIVIVWIIIIFPEAFRRFIHFHVHLLGNRWSDCHEIFATFYSCGIFSNNYDVIGHLMWSAFWKKKQTKLLDGKKLKQLIIKSTAWGIRAVNHDIISPFIMMSKFDKYNALSKHEENNLGLPVQRQCYRSGVWVSPRGEALEFLPNTRSRGHRTQITRHSSGLLSNHECRLVLPIRSVTQLCVVPYTWTAAPRVGGGLMSGMRTLVYSTNQVEPSGAASTHQLTRANFVG